MSNHLQKLLTYTQIVDYLMLEILTQLLKMLLLLKKRKHIKLIHIVKCLLKKQRKLIAKDKKLLKNKLRGQKIVGNLNQKRE